MLFCYIKRVLYHNTAFSREKVIYKQKTAQSNSKQIFSYEIPKGDGFYSTGGSVIMDYGLYFSRKQWYKTCSFLLHKTLIDGLEWCGLLWFFYKPTLILTAPIHSRGSIGEHVLNSPTLFWWRNKLIYILHVLQFCRIFKHISSLILPSILKINCLSYYNIILNYTMVLTYEYDNQSSSPDNVLPQYHAVIFPLHLWSIYILFIMQVRYI